MISNALPYPVGVNLTERVRELRGWGRIMPHTVERNNSFLKVTKAEPLNNLQIIFPESLLQPVNKSITKPKVHAWRFRDR